jgi:predicted DNA-binding protein (UPF0278 family)
MGFLEHHHATEEVMQQWHVEDQLIEESYRDAVEFGSIDSADDFLQVLAIALEVKIG